MSRWSDLIEHIKTRVAGWSRDSGSAAYGEPALAAAGLYHYIRENPGERSRIHLRVDPDGSGILLVNASRVMHLNPTAAFMARMALEELPEDDAVHLLMDRYQVDKPQAQRDYHTLVEQLNELIRPDGACPVHDLDLEVTAPFSARPSAPYRMDLALTYRCNNDCAHCYNARPRDYAEIDTKHWFRILDRLWELSIPHVVFTGGEPTLRHDLPELIAYAERNGQVTGLNTNARRLSDRSYLQRLVDAGLDHVQITVESHDPAIHDRMVRAPGAWKQTIAGLENVLDSPLYVMTNTTMLKENSPFLAGTLEFLASLGVPTVGLNALIYSGHGLTVGTGLNEKELTPLLETARSLTQANEQRLIWYTPTQYCHFDPMQLELGVKGCTAALYNMCVEPDGAVIPCQSYYQTLGNLLDDPWDSIWNHELSVSLRERKWLPAKCTNCVLKSECGGGCPLYAQREGEDT
ncbi:MAG: PqqD family peptide modification chaperone [Anaerolineales bacterium]|nr:PqqD family peptide modification chaperone [Anaerolineales bacterium]